jgi:hypothetical protein
MLEDDSDPRWVRRRWPEREETRRLMKLLTHRFPWRCSNWQVFQQMQALTEFQRPRNWPISREVARRRPYPGVTSLEVPTRILASLQPRKGSEGNQCDSPHFLQYNVSRAFKRQRAAQAGLINEGVSCHRISASYTGANRGPLWVSVGILFCRAWCDKKQARRREEARAWANEAEMEHRTTSLINLPITHSERKGQQ